MEQQSKKFLIHIRFGEGDKKRILEATKKVVETVEKLSNKKFSLAYTTEDAKSLGIIASINKPAIVIRAAIDGSGEPSRRFSISSPPNVTTGLLSGDSIFVLECGQDFSEIGFGKLLAWLQHN